MRIAVALLSALFTLGQPAQATPLRQVDWSSVLTSDPALTIDPSVANFAPTPGEPYVRVVNPSLTDQEQIAGYAALDNVQYGDIDGDGIDEAAILLESGGTAGNTGLLVYHQDQPRPRLAASLSGYKMGARIFNGALLVGQPEYAGFEPNCCPSAVVETHYSLQDQLVPIAAIEQPIAEAQPETVQQFYTLLDQHALADAYSFLSDAFQQAQPFDTWASGYATTQHVQVDDISPAASGGVSVAFSAVDQAPGGTARTQHFQGTWSLVWSRVAHRWLLDSATISPA